VNGRVDDLPVHKVPSYSRQLNNVPYIRRRAVVRLLPRFGTVYSFSIYTQPRTHLSQSFFECDWNRSRFRWPDVDQDVAVAAYGFSQGLPCNK